MSNGISVVHSLQCHLELFDRTKQIAPIADEIKHTPSYSLPKIGLNSLNVVCVHLYVETLGENSMFSHSIHRKNTNCLISMS